jgi:hypothetical protein
MKNYLIAVVAVALLLPFPAAAQDPPVPDVPIIDPIPAPLPVPEPLTPVEQTVGQQAVAAFQLILDTLGQHDRGAADLSEAEATLTSAEGIMTRAEQHLADVEAERQGSATTLVESIRAGIGVLEALILEYSPAQ